MLNVFFGNMPEAVYNTAVFFKNDYEDEWITDSLVKEMIRDVDHSEVIDNGVIDSPVLGKIPPLGLSGGVKTLILVLFEPGKVFNASTCGDNCAKWLLENRFRNGERILFTTYVTTLVDSVKSMLRAICTPEQLSRIDVITLDSILRKEWGRFRAFRPACRRRAVSLRKQSRRNSSKRLQRLRIRGLCC